MVIHIAAALVISAFQFNYGNDAWFLGFGIVTPILLIIHGFVYSYIEKNSWYREQMVPFMSTLITTTEIETDRYLQYHRRIARYFLIVGWFAILLCQWVWTLGLTEVMPFFAGDDLLIRFVGEFVGYAVILGPFFLYFLILILIAGILEKNLLSRYKDIAHLIDIENEWTKENHRRAKDPESALKEDPPSYNQW